MTTSSAQALLTLIVECVENFARICLHCNEKKTLSFNCNNLVTYLMDKANDEILFKIKEASAP